MKKQRKELSLPLSLLLFVPVRPTNKTCVASLVKPSACLSGVRALESSLYFSSKTARLVWIAGPMFDLLRGFLTSTFRSFNIACSLMLPSALMCSYAQRQVQFRNQVANVTTAREFLLLVFYLHDLSDHSSCAVVVDGDGNVGKTIRLITQDKKRTWMAEMCRLLWNETLASHFHVAFKTSWTFIRSNSFFSFRKRWWSSEKIELT